MTIHIFYQRDFGRFLIYVSLPPPNRPTVRCHWLLKDWVFIRIYEKNYDLINMNRERVWRRTKMCTPSINKQWHSACWNTPVTMSFCRPITIAQPTKMHRDQPDPLKCWRYAYIKIACETNCNFCILKCSHCGMFT